MCWEGKRVGLCGTLGLKVFHEVVRDLGLVCGLAYFIRWVEMFLGEVGKGFGAVSDFTYFIWWVQASSWLGKAGPSNELSFKTPYDFIATLRPTVESLKLLMIPLDQQDLLNITSYSFLNSARDPLEAYRSSYDSIWL